MRELEELEKYIQLAEPGLSDEDRKHIRNALGYTRDAFTLLEDKYLDSIKDRAVVHSLLKKTSEDLLHRYQAIFEYSGAAMVVLDRDGTITLANTNFATLLGYPRNEIEGRRKFSEFADTLLNNLIGQYLLHKGPEDVALLPHSEGHMTSVRDGERTVFVRIGKFPDTGQCVLSITDITENKRAEEALRESEEKYRTLFDNAGDVIFIHSMSGRILTSNALSSERYGYSPGELQSMSVKQVDSTDDATLAPARIARVREQGQLSFESVHRRKDGSLFPVMVSARLITWEGHPAVMSICHDITAIKHAEEALRLTNRKLNLLSGITRHDIKNQLSALFGYLVISESTLGNPEKTAGFIEKEKNIAEIISNQISFTKDYEDLGVNAPAWQDLSGVIETVTARIPLGDVRVESGTPLPEVLADPLLEKVFYNLIDNAQRYGGPKLTAIRISARKAGEGLVITVDDDGNGISADNKPNLFEKGFGNNTGLGLFLSREILSITDCTIEETGEPGKGARFEITVPKGQYRFLVNRPHIFPGHTSYR